MAAIIIGNHGNLKVDVVGVYNDINCTIATTYLDWGTLEPSSTRNITVYVRNEGNHAATLFMAVDSWNSANASSFMSLSWDYDGRTIPWRKLKRHLHCPYLPM